MFPSIVEVFGSWKQITRFSLWSLLAMAGLQAASLASLNAVVALLSLGAYPVWSVIILVLDGLVIYALTVYGTGRSTA